MDESDDPPDAGEIVGRIIGTVVILVFIGVATAGFYLADRHFSARGLLYDEALSRVVEMPDASVPSPEWDGRLVRASGEVRIAEGAEEPLFGVRAEAVCIRREVQYYQWVEVRRGRDGTSASGPRYGYVKRWVSRPVDSDRFRVGATGRRNVVSVPIDSITTPAARVFLGGYELSDALKVAFPGGEALPFSLDLSRLSGVSGSVPVHQTDENEVYFGVNPGRPSLGDVRVRLFAVHAGRVSVVGMVRGGELREFTGGNGERLALVGEDVSLGRLWWVNSVGRWGIRLGLGVVYGLLFCFLAMVHEWGARGMFCFGAAAGCVAMFVVWCVTGGVWIGWGMLYLVVAAAFAGLGMSRRR